MRVEMLVFVLFRFFFFKQKTAYEMRISDWSSDVCSSDLGDEAAGELGALIVQSPNHVVDPFLGNLVLVGQGVDLAFDRPGGSKIGRASCRERVCQYV